MSAIVFTMACSLVVAIAATSSSSVHGKTGGFNRPQLLPYDPQAPSAAIVVASDGFARFTVLTDRLIRMEYARVKGQFEDRASLAVLHRNTSTPAFTHAETSGVLTIATDEVVLKYTVGKGFTPNTLSVAPAHSSSSFPGWKFGDPNPGNLLGTIRGQDGQSATPLNCTQNKGVEDNGEFNHCEWGLVSRNGWVVYDDSLNAFTDENDWWSTTGHTPPPPPPGLRNCSATPMTNTDAASPANCPGVPEGGVHADTVKDCCSQCVKITSCNAYVYDPQAKNCWPLTTAGGTKQATDRLLGFVGSHSDTPTGPQFSDVQLDLYGFFHGLNFTDALQDYSIIGGKAIMVPKNAMGVWWSRWFDLNNYDTRKVVLDYEAADMPLDVFVIDMDWHQKNDWSGFTFDAHLFPFADDSMGELTERGLSVTLNLHDASGVNYWEALFPELVQSLGLPNSSTKVPMNLINSTVAYAVEDIILGDLIKNKHISFWWIDWQQGGTAGGMTGNKQNPTIWLAHLRCTDRHRVGDDTRAMVLARWGGMGHHRYQVGFSGDVAGLTWSNMAYQPYFSATAANVLFPSWSHDIEGGWDDLELYTRWIQAGSFSGTMRSHDRGMSGGGCANTNGVTPSIWGPDTGDCSVIAPWNVGPKFVDANRRALQGREKLLPYIYTMHRQLFDTGVGILQPMYYHNPDLDGAYRMNASANAQYFFGNDILVAPITAPAGGQPKGDPSQTLATKEVWLPPGTWFDVLTGKVLTVSDSTGSVVSRGYTLGEIPMWTAAGAIIPYLPLKSLKSLVGVAVQQWEYLGFKITPCGGSAPCTSAQGRVYEDDGTTTAYLDGESHVWTEVKLSSTGTSTTVSISSKAGGATPYSSFPAKRNYQLRLPNNAPPAAVSVSVGATKDAASDVPFVRFGAIRANRGAPPTSQWYYEFAEDEGLGPVIDLVDMPTDQAITVTLTASKAASEIQTALNGGVFGTLIRSVYSHAQMDLDRSNPDSNSPGPAFLSQLSSVGVALERLADPSLDATKFSSMLGSIPALVANATAEVGKAKSPRVPYALALLA